MIQATIKEIVDMTRPECVAFLTENGYKVTAIKKGYIVQKALKTFKGMYLNTIIMRHLRHLVKEEEK